MVISSYFEICKTFSWTSHAIRRTLASAPGPVESRINLLLSRKFEPTFLKIYNESHLHSRKLGLETHFRVVIVSPHFNTLSAVKRERLVFKSLENELQSGVHALSIIVSNFFHYSFHSRLGELANLWTCIFPHRVRNLLNGKLFIELNISAKVYQQL
ncbi:unnamed protein product [Heterobilharzia americana]|nr:unnamed protein product [Heterobilharzia americana]